VQYSLNERLSGLAAIIERTIRITTNKISIGESSSWYKAKTIKQAFFHISTETISCHSKQFDGLIAFSMFTILIIFNQTTKTTVII